MWKKLTDEEEEEHSDPPTLPVPLFFRQEYSFLVLYSLFILHYRSLVIRVECTERFKWLYVIYI
jgi:hypothetical protein